MSASIDANGMAELRSWGYGKGLRDHEIDGLAPLLAQKAAAVDANAMGAQVDAAADAALVQLHLEDQQPAPGVFRACITVSVSWPGREGLPRSRPYNACRLMPLFRMACEHKNGTACPYLARR